MNILAAVKTEVDKFSKNNKVILFGSRARGDFKAKSDWDILILLDNVTVEEKNAIIDQLYEIELATDQIITSIIYSQKEWEKRSITPLYKIIQDEGKEYELSRRSVGQI